MALRSVPPRRSRTDDPHLRSSTCAHTNNAHGVASRPLTARATIVPMRDLYPTTTDASGCAYPAVLTPARADVFFASANRVMMAAERTFARAGQTLARADHTFELGAAR